MARTTTMLLVFLFICSTSCLPSSKRDSQSEQQLAECSESSFCGYVQLNGNGISTQKSCNCPTGSSCPLTWDPFDGKTVQHGFDQYKYCDLAPELRPCSGHEIAYSTSMAMSLITMETISNSNQLHCLCPRSKIFVRNATRFLEAEDGLSLILTEHLCLSAPVCESRQDVCMAITESSHSTFVTKKCTCQRGKYCPKDIRLASERIDLDRGAYFTFQCR